MDVFIGCALQRMEISAIVLSWAEGGVPRFGWGLLGA